MKRPSSFPRHILGVAICLAASACGPTVKNSLPPGGVLPSSIAVLPADYSGEIPREHVDLVREAIISGLRNQNFIVVEDKVVQSTCSTPQCPEKSTLAGDYLVDSFATISLESFSKNNFLAGYFNELHGKLSITDVSGKELTTIDHTQTESGGVLFQSGQVFQGIISQVKHSSDSVFEDIADSFAKTIIEKLPAHSAPASAQRSEGLEVALTSATVQWSGQSSYTVCAQGTPHSFAYLLLDQTRSSLREISPGRYCGGFSTLVAPTAGGVQAVELRTAFGNSVRHDITIPVQPPCNLTNRVSRPSPSQVSIACTKMGPNDALPSSGCSSSLSECAAAKVVVYAAPQASGPFRKVSESTTQTINVSPSQQTIAVVAIAKGGVSSQPATISGSN